MTEFHPKVFLVDNVTAHPYADRLDMINVYGGYPCAVTKDKYKVGDTAIYIPVDCMVDTKRPEFKFLDKNGREEFVHIKALMLRNIFSMGLVIDNIGNWPVDYEPVKELDVRRFEPVSDDDSDDVITGLSIMPTYDLEPLRMYHHKFRMGEEVILTEKINGTNSGFVFSTAYNCLILRSSTRYRRYNPESYSDWNRIAKKYNFQEVLRAYPGIGIYGEICGGSLVKGFNYGITNPIERKLLVFDAIDTRTHRWLHHSETCKMILDINTIFNINLEMVPWSIMMPWTGIDNENISRYSNGGSLEGNHIREGCVIESLERERFDDGTRAKLKLHGEDYLLKRKLK